MLFAPHPCLSRSVYGGGISQIPALPGRKDPAHMEAIDLGRLLPLAEYVSGAKSCVYHSDSQALYQLTSGNFSVADVEQQEWSMPAGAFHGAAGVPC